MSRHEIPARDQTLSVASDGTIRSRHTSPRSRGPSRPTMRTRTTPCFYGSGRSPREVITVEDLARHLAPFADLATEMAQQLRAERVAMLGQAPTATQQEMLAFIRRTR
jgi:hypothetical protein